MLLLLGFTACGGEVQEQTIQENGVLWEDLTFDCSTQLEYAEKFSIDHTAEGYALIHIVDEGEFLIVPEGQAVPVDVPKDIIVLQQPLENVYLAATSAMDYFCAMDGLDALRFSGTQADGWFIEEAKEALEKKNKEYEEKLFLKSYKLLKDK